MEPQAPIRQKIIREIKPSPVLQARTRNHKLRVAAYCRVSTEQEEQQTSIENQITYYDDLIRSNPEWEYAGVFSDDGISGTRDENRPGFMEMIKQIENGLTEEQKKIFSDKGEGYSLKEIADNHGIKQKRVYKQFDKVKRIVTEAMEA